MVLGLTFNSGVAIGYAAFAEAIAWDIVLPFYFGGVLWTMLYDTIYAFQDRAFDKSLNLRSMAIEIENKPKESLTALATASTALFLLGGINAGIANPAFLAGLMGVGAGYAWQIYTLDIENRESCWNRFVFNKWLGLGLFGTITAGKWYRDRK